MMGLRKPTTNRLGADSAREFFFPEVRIAGVSRVDGTVAFYEQVQALLRPDMVVVNLGAGRGRVSEDPVPLRRELQTLRGKVARVIGLDVDEAVLANAGVDEAAVISEEHPLPLSDGFVDVVLADWTLEHIQSPTWAAREILRILKPGGWMCARTPNKSGYIAVGARLVSNRFQNRALHLLQPDKEDHDTFPVAYHLNTGRALRTFFPPDRFQSFSFMMNNEPAYAGNSRVLWWLFLQWFRLMPASMQAIRYEFLRKL